MVKVDDQIITNVDLNQQKFLLIFNDNLKTYQHQNYKKFQKELIKELLKENIDKLSNMMINLIFPKN